MFAEQPVRVTTGLEAEDLLPVEAEQAVETALLLRPADPEPPEEPPGALEATQEVLEATPEPEEMAEPEETAVLEEMAEPEKVHLRTPFPVSPGTTTRSSLLFLRPRSCVTVRWMAATTLTWRPTAKPSISAPTTDKEG